MTITDDILQEANMTEAELKTELAVLLYQKQKLSMGLAARLADMDRIRFQFLLGSRQISVNYDEAAFEEDLQIIKRLNANEVSQPWIRRRTTDVRRSTEVRIA